MYLVEVFIFLVDAAVDHEHIAVEGAGVRAYAVIPSYL